MRDVTHTGQAVVDTEEGAVFTRGALPGERVRVAIEGRRQKVLRGTLTALIEPSPDRVSAACALAERCGGCALMSLSIEAQRKLKLEHVRRATREVRVPGVDAQLELAGEPLGYRRRVRFSFKRVGQRALVGYRAFGSHAIVDVELCPVLEAPLSAALTLVREELVAVLEGAGEIELAKAEPDHVVLSITCEQVASVQAYRAVEALVGRGPIVGTSLRVGQGAAATFGEVVQSSRGSDGLLLHAPPQGFTQANRLVNERLVELVLELAEARGADALELYAGHGNFTVALAPLAKSLLAIEGDHAAVEACRQNLRVRGLRNVRVLAGDAAQVGRATRADVLVVDPPRTGAPALRAIVEQTQPARVVYVSCDMTTLRRDLQQLASLGYQADRVHALDMFPQTGHVEAVVRMVRVRPSSRPS